MKCPVGWGAVGGLLIPSWCLHQSVFLNTRGWLPDGHRRGYHLSGIFPCINEMMLSFIFGHEILLPSVFLRTPPGEGVAGSAQQRLCVMQGNPRPLRVWCSACGISAPWCGFSLLCTWRLHEAFLVMRLKSLFWINAILKYMFWGLDYCHTLILRTFVCTKM